MKKDYEFVYKVIRHKENNSLHYPALKNLVTLFLNKWNHKENNKILNVYTISLKSALRASRY